MPTLTHPCKSVGASGCFNSAPKWNTALLYSDTRAASLMSDSASADGCKSFRDNAPHFFNLTHPALAWSLHDWRPTGPRQQTTEVRKSVLMTFAIPVLSRLRSWLAAQEVMRLAALVAIAVFLADWASKLWAAEIVASGVGFDPLLLLPTHNTAFAFSAGSEQVDTPFVMAARFAALYGLAYVFSRKVICDERSAAGLGCVLGGGIGNTADLAVDNAVLDFMNVGPFPFQVAGESFNVHFVFNAADVAILIGIALLAPRLQVCALHVQRRIAAWESTKLNRR